MAVRNILVRRRGLVDEEFLGSYPDTPLKASDEFPVDYPRFHGYWRAAMWYALELLCRTRKSLGLPEEALVIEARQKYRVAAVLPPLAPHVGRHPRVQSKAD